MRRSILLLSAAAIVAGCEEPVRPVERDSLDVVWQLPLILGAPPEVLDSIVVLRSFPFRADRNTLSGHRATTGEELWRIDVSPYDFDAPMRSSNGRVIEPPDPLIVVDALTGAKLWEYESEANGDKVAKQLVVDADRVFFPDAGTAVALSLETGEPAWSTPLGGSLSRPVVGPDVVLYHRQHEVTFSSQEKGAELIALDRATGEERWRVVVEGESGFPGGSISSAVVYGDRVIAGDIDGKLMAFDVVDGGLLWEIPNAAPPHAFGFPLQFAGIIAYARTDGVIEAHSPTDGALLWSTAVEPYDPYV